MLNNKKIEKKSNLTFEDAFLKAWRKGLKKHLPGTVCCIQLKGRDKRLKLNKWGG